MIQNYSIIVLVIGSSGHFSTLDNVKPYRHVPICLLRPKYNSQFFSLRILFLLHLPVSSSHFVILLLFITIVHGRLFIVLVSWTVIRNIKNSTLYPTIWLYFIHRYHTVASVHFKILGYILL